MNSLDQYIGGEFAWFTGVVEDIIDPMQMGRVRVRCFGYHTDDKSEIPTDSLPWALVMTPITSAGMGGIGQSATGVLQGSWVIGFFRDGKSAQDPIVMGTVPSMTMGGNPLKGFSDPRNVYPITPGDIDLPKESRSDFFNTESYVKRKQLRQEKIETAVPGKLSSVAVPEASSYYTRNTWSNWDVDTVVNPIGLAQLRVPHAGSVEIRRSQGDAANLSGARSRLPHARDLCADCRLLAIGGQRHVFMQRLILRAVHVQVVDHDHPGVRALRRSDEVAHRLRPGRLPDLARILEPDGDDRLLGSRHRPLHIIGVERVAVDEGNAGWKICRPLALRHPHRLPPRQQALDRGLTRGAVAEDGDQSFGVGHCGLHRLLTATYARPHHTRNA